jgi:hypothetical protein
MRINKACLFSYFENLLGSSYYVGLHGISDDSDFKNEFSSLSKEDKAKNIMKSGLINSRRLSIKSTCTIFGRLSETYKTNKSKILDFNKYKAYFSTGKEYVVVVAIPILFMPSDGRILFGGWMDCDVSYNDDNSPFECISDKLCRMGIPKEFILGYYSYNENDSDVDFVFNNKFYSELSVSKKDEFINNFYGNKRCFIDLEKGIDYCNMLLDESRNALFYQEYNFDLVGNLIRQLNTNFTFNEELNIDDKFYYSTKSFYAIDLDAIDMDRVKPSYEMIFNGIYSIPMKEIIINKKYNGRNLCDEVGFYYSTKIDDDSFVDLLIFEEWVKHCGNNPKNVFYQYYQMNYKEINEEFIDYIKFVRDNNNKKMGS